MRNRSTFSLLFWANTSRLKNGQVPIYVRITVNGKRANLSLQRRIPLSNWDASRGNVKGTNQQSKGFNKYLEQVRAKIYQSYEDLLGEDKIITAQLIKSRFLGINGERKSLLELFEYHNKISEEKLNCHTLRHYKVTQGYLKKFLSLKLQTTDIWLQNLNYSFIVDFEYFIKSYQPKDHQRKMGHNTAMKHMQRLRKMVTMAYHLEWIVRDPFVRFKTYFENNSREFLKPEELKSLEKFHSSIPRLNIINDLFLFSCYTGICYADINSLTKDNIIKGSEGGYWVKSVRKKTNSVFEIPLLKKAKDLIRKYEGHPRTSNSNSIFPCFSNQKINSYLKEIAELNGINKNLTFHMARHTFATTITLCNGVPIETVSKLLGHTKIATTQIYARVITKKVFDDMQILQKKLNKSQKFEQTEV